MISVCLALLLVGCRVPASVDSDETVVLPAQARAAPVPLHMEDGACVGEPPAPICEPVHLSTPKPVDDPRACDTRDDCLPTEFCGAGVCRILDGEQATLCVQRAWIEGPLCAGDEHWLAVDGYISGSYVEGGDFGWRRPREEGECVVEGLECTVIELSAWAHNQVSLVALITAEERGGVQRAYAHENFVGRERLRSLIDAGCYTLRGTDPIPGWDTHPYAHIALWYP
jgi:hypothetical protein